MDYKAFRDQDLLQPYFLFLWLHRLLYVSGTLPWHLSYQAGCCLRAFVLASPCLICPDTNSRCLLLLLFFSLWSNIILSDLPWRPYFKLFSSKSSLPIFLLCFIFLLVFIIIWNMDFTYLLTVSPLPTRI